MITGAGQEHFGAVLAGGGSKRFGSPKALARIAGSTMLERILYQHRRAGLEPIIVSTSAAGLHTSGARVVPDVIAGVGPLGGVHAALAAAHDGGATGVCFTPCDAPLVDAALFRALIGFSIGVDAVLPIDDSSGRVQPLFGWYSSRLVSVIESCIGDGDRSVHGFVGRVPTVRFIHSDDLVLPIAANLLFLNVNTPAQMDLARDAAVCGETP